MMVKVVYLCRACGNVKIRQESGNMVYSPIFCHYHPTGGTLFQMEEIWREKKTSIIMSMEKAINEKDKVKH